MKVVRKISKKALRLDKKPLVLLFVFVLQFAFPQISAAQAIKKYDENVLINEINGVEWPACLNTGECLNRSFLVPKELSMLLLLPILARQNKQMLLPVLLPRVLMFVSVIEKIL